MGRVPLKGSLLGRAPLKGSLKGSIRKVLGFRV